jgi:hypothetical protein
MFLVTKKGGVQIISFKKRNHPLPQIFGHHRVGSWKLLTLGPPMFSHRMISDWNLFLITICIKGYPSVRKIFHASVLKNVMDTSRHTPKWCPMQNGSVTSILTTLVVSVFWMWVVGYYWLHFFIIKIMLL